VAHASNDITWYMAVLLLAGAAGFATGMFMIAMGVTDLLAPRVRLWIAGTAGIDPKRLERGCADTPADYRERGRERITRGAILAGPSLVLMIVNAAVF
jgi:hypothetical protein